MVHLNPLTDDVKYKLQSVFHLNKSMKGFGRVYLKFLAIKLKFTLRA